MELNRKFTESHCTLVTTKAKLNDTRRELSIILARFYNILSPTKITN